ncbi:hypothetical protein ABA45_02285 [Marinobacter psychrophilus]|uniref:Uncharacterized protein n=1 Tax=Marinobacter psychrophilus TaxID=330734 RepID=A0A0H4I0M8_9GAMM|nr:hypothetical protein [Marinobacter psychrophilus]AKO51388.1 hypothetical protein ABA45_02285 [Marinobacter psychrophilus]
MEVDIHFYCPCGAVIEKTLPVPPQDPMAEQHSDSGTEYFDSAICDGCGKNFDVEVTDTYFEVDVIVAEAVDLSFDVRDLPEEDDVSWIIQSTQQFEEFTEVIQGVVALVETSVPTHADRTLRNMLYVQTVTTVEAYLSGAFIHAVLNSEELIQKLVESDPELAKQKFSLKEIFTQWEGLRITVGKYLKALIFHDLRKIKPMFKDVLGIEFPDIPWLFQAVLIRHDCVHRNGLDKDGNRHEITKSQVMELARSSADFVSQIDQELRCLVYENTSK